MRIPIFWKDRVVEFPKRVRETDLGGGYTQVDKAPGEVIVEGTPMNASHLNDMDYGIVEAAMMAKFHNDMLRKMQDSIEGLDGEKITVTLTNSQAYPFNNSKKTVGLSKNRNKNDYTVHVEVQSYTGGGVGDIEISEKLLNGFKIAHTGAASSVTVICTVQGGI